MMDIGGISRNVTVHSHALDSRVKIKVGCLESRVKRPDFEKLLEDPLLKFSGLCLNEQSAELRVELQVFSGNQPICLPVSTSYKSFTTRWNWNEWVTLPLRFSDLPLNSNLCLTVYDCGGPSKQIAVGGTTIRFFGKNGVFRQGMIDLKVWPAQVADGSDPTLTPGKGPKGNRMYRLKKLAKRHQMGQIAKVDWLDRLTFCEIEAICEKEKRESDFMYLNIEFPIAEYSGVQYAITFYEKNVEDMEGAGDSRALLGETVWLPDHEILLDNLVENKHHTLSRCTRTGLSDVDLKPNAVVRDQLNAIVNYPPTKQLSAEENDLIWKFRYYLSSNKKALAKFLKCVKWEIAAEEKQALELLEKWAPMDVQDALELLGPQFSHPEVRSYAVQRLTQAPDDDLLLYLLQLVQALKYENIDLADSLDLSTMKEIQSPPLSDNIRSELNLGSLSEKDKEFVPTSPSHIANSVIASPSSGLGSASENNSNSDASLSSNMSAVASTPAVSESDPTPEKISRTLDVLGSDKLDLAKFLIHRACENTTLVNYFYWYLVIECEDHDVGVKQDPRAREMYKNVMRKFIHCMGNGKTEWQKRREVLSRQQKFIIRLVDVVKTVAKESANRQKKIEKLQALLADDSSHKMNFAKFDPLPFPVDPEIYITGIVPKEATLFKSSQMPCRLTFLTTSGEPYIAIFKHGDDLRQDQLILQMITLMDKLLRKENLDLKLTPYRVLSTSTTHGFVQFIPSTTVAEVLATEGTIQSFFRKHHPSEKDLYGISPSVMDTYVKSCAGYCVITYLLGVGDRHLDNLLLTKDGKLFHIDFGFILGRDPKPMPPPMKLSKEMVEAMGGIQSEYYQEFRKLCYTAFLHLRRHANLILNLFSLMVGASVPDIALEPDKAVKKVLDKFCLDLNDEAAVKHMQELIDVSVTAFMPALLEQMHKFTQMLRK
ncbi:unnamed protein product [Orchesella dallaii]|uniref:Phosphatidylinositol 3-kinase catalytic subunit type 3 n=1 Tax=Orchesella dallaii TaxID=48710 RepID=A0ABP1Q5W6_9HEXA